MKQYERVVQMLEAGTNKTAIARELGLSRSSVRGYLKDAAKRGMAPGLVKAPDVPGFVISPKTTVQYDGKGNIVNEWRRMSPEQDAMEEVISAMEERVAGKAPKIKAPKACKSDLMLEYPIPDHHMGMLSWSKETGADYDCKLATDLLVGGAKSIINECPPVGKILLVVLGDYYHSDNRSGMTERSGNVLDTDSRFMKRVEAGIEALCGIIEASAAAAQEVEVIILSGNHDWHSAKWLSLYVSAYYRNEKRITIRTHPAPRQYVQHGKVMLGYMHGDTMKAGKFASVIPAEQGEMWSNTEFRYGRVGHWHHRVTEEHPGVIIETLPTLAAPDAYAIEHGYMSRRALTAYLWHNKFGLRAKMERCPQEILA